MDPLADKTQPTAAASLAAGAAAPATDPCWYKDAVIYELHIKAFCDGNGDGIGDFTGLISKLDHVRDLGVNTVWLLPFYPSPLRDDGYDVADFLGVHAAYGAVADVERLVQEAHARGLRVITELVVNHTSDQHPWFQAARRAPRGSAERDFYVWGDDPTRYASTRIIFTDAESSNWTWDEVAGQYFWHRFFSHQPDLNFDNPAVREAVFGVMEFWLDKGVDGFRLDAIPYLVEREGTSNENLRETHAVIKELRQRLDAKYSDKLLLAEANMWPEDVREYFGEEDECHMAYHFPLMPRMYMAIAQEDRHPVVEILQQTPEIPPTCQWAIFLRNHDELTLEMVTSKERDYMYSMYAADPRARINLGIRRRLAPLLENDRERIKLMNSLLLSMPGSPVLYYGDEIGMGDNIFLGDRDGVRTPMQWSGERNGGFSRADPQRVYLPPIQDPVYGYEAVNVEAQLRDASSLLHWTRRLLAVRRSTRVFGRGRITMLHPGNRKILAYLRETDGEGGEAVLCVANLSRSAQPVELDLSRFKGRVPVEMAGHMAFAPVTELPYPLTLPAYGFFWFRLTTDVQPPEWHARRQAVDDLAVLVLFDGWNSLFRDRVVPWRIAMATKTLAQFEGELLPRFLARQGWYLGGANRLAKARVADHAVLSADDCEWLLAFVDAPVTKSDAGARWLLPLSLAWEDGDEERLRQLAPVALAKVRTQACVGVMADALADAAFCRALVHAVASASVLRTTKGTLRGVPTDHFSTIAGLDGDRPTTGAPAAELHDAGAPHALSSSHNTTTRVGPRLFLKLLRQVQPGVNAEVEMAQFLHGAAAYKHAAPLAGSVEFVAPDGSTSTLALLHAWVPNQGSAWTLAVAHLARELDRAGTEGGGASAAQEGDAAGSVALGFLESARLLGRRTAELHATLARHQGETAFEPEPLTLPDLQRWAAQARAAAAATLAMLREPSSQTPSGSQALAVAMAAAATIDRLAAGLSALSPAGHRSRIHGACRLQEFLLVNNDFVIVDFEGYPTSPLSERRSKQSPLRDVASLLHSFDLARLAALQSRGHEGAEAAQREGPAREWSRALRSAFMAAYGSSAVAAGLWPDAATLAAHGALGHLFEVELAVRELGQALQHRSANQTTAMAALVTLLARPGAA